ncbi:MAG: class I SAM-dependent methyltransferase [Cellvibrionaceae bacterium]
MSESFTEKSVYGVRVLNGRHKKIKDLKKQGFHAEIHGNKFWKSSYLLMDYLKENPIKPGSRVLEVGCGWGIAGIYAAKKFDCHITGLDADENVFPYMRVHAEANEVDHASWHCRFEKAKPKDLQNFDVIIGSDICFWDELAKPLYKLVERAHGAGVPRIVLADPGRDPFRSLAEKCEKKLDGDFLDWEVKKPEKASGWLMTIES